MYNLYGDYIAVVVYPKIWRGGGAIVDLRGYQKQPSDRHNLDIQEGCYSSFDFLESQH